MTTEFSHLVVDGSNIATEGRSIPSLAQLDAAVTSIIDERQYEHVTVIVDATFSHRIDSSEVPAFDEAIDNGEVITPPAGVVGRGDAFILQVARKASAAILSNDSFQEFHGEHDWIFEEGRLIGAKPIEGVGWIFVERVPVRGPKSRRSIKDAQGSKQSRGTSKKRSRQKKSSTPKRSSGSAKMKPLSDAPPPPPPVVQAKTTRPAPASKSHLNDPMAFLEFVSKYSLGDLAPAVVEKFASHGCYVNIGSALCYLPSKTMGEPPPNKARDVVSLGQHIEVSVESLDSDRRGINVSLVRVFDAEDTDVSEVPRAKRHDMTADSGEEQFHTRRNDPVAKAKKKTVAKKAVAAKKATKRKAASKKPAAAKRAAAKKPAAAKRKAAAKKAAPKRKAAAKKTATKKAAPKRKAAAKKTATKKAAPKRKVAAKKAAPKRKATATASARAKRAKKR